jgi:hypothetical protein
MISSEGGDDLRFFRGLLIALPISLGMWAGIIALAWVAFF